MHPAPSLAEAPPNTNDEPRSNQGQPPPPPPPPPPPQPPQSSPTALGPVPTPPRLQAQQKQQQQQQVKRLELSPTDPRIADLHSEPSSPALRKDSVALVATPITSTAPAAWGSLLTTTAEMAEPPIYGMAETALPPPSSFHHHHIPGGQSMFTHGDPPEISPVIRRTSRRRTGPLSAVQRERAALIRKLGACGDCRRRRVACHPNHHHMTWEDAARKYGSHPSTVQDLPPLSGRPLSPAPPKGNFVHPSSMAPHNGCPEIEMMGTRPPPPPMPEPRLRTPLPSGPRPDRALGPTLGATSAPPPPPLPPSLPPPQPPQPQPPPQLPLPPLPLSANMESLKSDLQATASRVISTPGRTRYSAVHALLLSWKDDDEDPGVCEATRDLATVLQQSYNYKIDIQQIPSSSNGPRTSSRWLSGQINEFVDHYDQRDVLKIVYYIGYTYLDGDREMVLASSRNAETTSTIRWSGIQQILGEACTDILIVMDAAFYPSPKPVRPRGVLELIAAATSQDHFTFLDRGSFTRALVSQLQKRASQTFKSALSAAELHAWLLAHYPEMIKDRNPEAQMLTNFPSPLHMQVSGNYCLPSIVLPPLLKEAAIPQPLGPSSAGPILNIHFRLTHSPNLDLDSWSQWIRMLPDGVQDIRVESCYRSTCR